MLALMTAPLTQAGTGKVQCQPGQPGETRSQSEEWKEGSLSLLSSHEALPRVHLYVMLKAGVRAGGALKEADILLWREHGLGCLDFGAPHLQQGEFRHLGWWGTCNSNPETNTH